MKRLASTWYYISVFLAGALVVALGIGGWGLRERATLAMTAVLFLHFFEEFGFPGGFPWMGLHVEMGVSDTDSSKWTLNQLNSLVGNWWFAVVVFLGALALPSVRFMTLAVALFGYIELAMHGIGFNAAMRTFYNPGLATAVGLAALSTAYLVQAAGLYAWTDVALALAWIALNYWLVFRSPLYQWMGRKSDRYAFTEDEVMRGRRYIERCAKRE